MQTWPLMAKSLKTLYKCGYFISGWGYIEECNDF